MSRTHATLERLGSDWTIADDGLSRNGTWVNEERVTARRRLRDGDIVRVGGTALAFCAPGPGPRADATLTAEGVPVGDILTPAQRRVLVALCRPYRDAAFATPASNPAIARELSVSVDAVKSTMRTLFDVFGIGDLPQNQKRGGPGAAGAARRRAHAPRPLAQSIRVRRSSATLVTHTERPLTSTATGLKPTRIGRPTTRPVWGRCGPPTDRRSTRPTPRRRGRAGRRAGPAR